MSNIIDTTGRSITTITTEIRVITRQTQQMVLSAAIEIGRRLTEAKELVPHGQWGEYLQNEVDFSQSTANNFMQLYKEYGDDQQSLFSANSQALGNLSYTKALRLLVLPAEEREDFVQENNVEDMSTRELENALRERDAARKEAEDSKAALQKSEERLRTQEKLCIQQKELTEKAEGKAARVAELEKNLQAARNKTAELEQELKKQKENPQVAEDVMAKLRKEAELSAAREAEKKATSMLEQERKAMQSQIAQKDSIIATLEAEAKKQKISDPDVTAVQVLGKKLMEDWNATVGHWKAAVQKDAANREPVRKYLTAVLAKMQESIAEG